MHVKISDVFKDAFGAVAHAVGILSKKTDEAG